MVVPQRHPKMIIFSRKTNGCWVITTVLGNPQIGQWLKYEIVRGIRYFGFDDWYLYVVEWLILSIFLFARP